MQIFYQVEGPNNFCLYLFRLFLEEVLEIMLVERDLSIFLILGHSFDQRSKDTICFTKVKLHCFLTFTLESHLKADINGSAAEIAPLPSPKTGRELLDL